jgi:hypothetical protein
MKKRLASYLVLPLLVLWAIAAPQPAAAQQGAANGTIFYARAASGWTQIMGMRADGSGKQSIPLAQVGTDVDYASLSPSNCVHGSDPIRHRWWVFPKITGHYDEWRDANGVVYTHWPHYDLFAARTNPSGPPVVIQLTDLYGIVNFQGEAFWSNDSNQAPDSCIYSNAYDLRGHVSIVEGDEEGETQTVVDAAEMNLGRTARVPITSSMIHQGWLAGNFTPLGPELEPETLDVTLNLMLWPEAYGIAYGMDAPGGQEIVSNRKHSSQVGAAIKVLDAHDPSWSNPLRVLWEGGLGLPQWSPNGNTVVISTGGRFAATGIIKTVPASGATPSQTLLPITTTSVKQGRKTVTATTSYGVARWSHDSNYLVVARATKIDTTVTQGIVRVSAGGGTPVSLNDDNTGYSLRPIRWVSNTVAP